MNPNPRLLGLKTITTPQVKEIKAGYVGTYTKTENSESSPSIVQRRGKNFSSNRIKDSSLVKLTRKYKMRTKNHQKKILFLSFVFLLLSILERLIA